VQVVENEVLAEPVAVNAVQVVESEALADSAAENAANVVAVVPVVVNEASAVLAEPEEQAAVNVVHPVAANMVQAVANEAQAELAAVSAVVAVNVAVNANHES